MDISVVIPLYNEEESIGELFEWIERVMDAHRFTYEVIFISDGSTDRSWDIVCGLHSKKPDCVKGIKFRRNYGKSPALYCGFKRALGDVVITMDADLQDSPDEIPELYRMVKEEGYDLVSGYKQKRYDPLSKTLPTKLFNATARRVSGIHNLHDFNCGLKAYRSDVVKNIEVYGEMHRYIPYLAKQAGFCSIGEKVVQHQARKYGESKFMGWNRFVNGYLDLLTLWFLTTFGKKPMHVFGFLGSLMFLMGFLATVVIAVSKLMGLLWITDSPYFYIALTTMVIGTQFFLTGFLGDLISRSSPNRNDYQVEAAFSLLLCCMAFGSCSSIDCPVQNTVAVYYAISDYDDDGNLTPGTLTDTLWVWTKRQDENDTILLNRLVDKSSFALPVSYQSPEDMFVFAVTDTLGSLTVDTLWIRKNDMPHLESVDCPAHFFHELTDTRSTHRRIDTAVISNPSVTYNPDVTNINIVFKANP